MKRLTRIAKTKINLGDQAIALITDSMANGLTIDIDYIGSGMRNNILPYGWSVSQSGDLLIMCYKATGDIRSYRFDRLLQVFVEDTLLDAYNEQPEIEEMTPEDYMIPPLPNIDEILNISENEAPDEPYEEAVDVLEYPDLDIEDFESSDEYEDPTIQTPDSSELEEGINPDNPSEQSEEQGQDSRMDGESEDTEERNT